MPKITENYERLECDYCGEWFYRHSSIIKRRKESGCKFNFCGKDCQYAFRRIQSNIKRIVTKRCVICNEPFICGHGTSKPSSKKTCGDDCGKELSKINRRNWRKRNPNYNKEYYRKTGGNKNNKNDLSKL